MLFDLLEVSNSISEVPMNLQLRSDSVMGDATDPSSLSPEEMLEAGLKGLITPHQGVIFGPVMLGFAVDLFLAGVMLKQLTMWWHYAREDRWFIKIIIIWVTIFGIIGTTFNIAMCFHFFVYNFGKYAPLNRQDWSSWLGLISPLTSAGVQVFYTDRAYKLSSKNRILALTILAAIVLSIIGGLGSKITSDDPDPVKVNLTVIFVYLLTAGAMVADFIITTAILWFLSQSKSGWNVTDKVVNKLLTISAESQLPPTLLAIAFLVIYAYKSEKGDPNVIDITSNLSIFFMMLIPKTYIIGFLAVLNARTSLRAEFGSSNETSSGRRKTTDFPLSVRRGGDTGIQITTEVYTQTEPYNQTKSFSPKRSDFRNKDLEEDGDEENIELDDVESLRRVGAGGSEAGSKTGLTWVENRG